MLLSLVLVGVLHLVSAELPWRKSSIMSFADSDGDGGGDLRAQSIDGEFLGCYEDNKIRLLPDFLINLPNVNSPTNCIYICQKLQYQYAGVESSTQCYCSIGKPYEIMKRDVKECNRKCPLSQENCGGTWRISVYSVNSTVFPATDHGIYIGCYKDNAPVRILNDFSIILSEINSPKRCIHLCTVLGYLYGGTESFYGDQCFCGNERPSDNMKTAENECQANCPYSQEKCGGDWRIAIFRTSVDPNADSIIPVSDERLTRNAIGCFENSGYGILPNYFMSLEGNSPKRCLYLCQQLGYRHAGVQNSRECYCGNQRPSESSRRSYTECQSTCPKSNEKCGGQKHIHVYSTQTNLF